MAFPPSAIASDKTDDTAIATDHPDHHNALAAAVNDITSEIQTWTVNRAAGGKDIDNIGRVGIGTTLATTTQLRLGGTESTASASQNRLGVQVDRATTFSGTGTHTYKGIYAAPSITANATVSQVFGMQFLPTVGGSGTITEIRAVDGDVTTTATATTAIGVRSRIGTLGATITTAVGVDVILSNVAGTVTTGVGLRMTSLTGSSAWAMQVGDYQSYHHGRMTLGSTTAPTYALDIKGTAQDRGVIALTETATPTNPAQSAQVLIYAKSDAIVFAFNDAGTMRYKSLTLSGTGVTWAHSTTAP